MLPFSILFTADPLPLFTFSKSVLFHWNHGASEEVLYNCFVQLHWHGQRIDLNKEKQLANTFKYLETHKANKNLPAKICFSTFLLKKIYSCTLCQTVLNFVCKRVPLSTFYIPVIFPILCKTFLVIFNKSYLEEFW